MTAFSTQDKDARLDWGVNWGLWLPSGDTIAASAWTAADANVTLDSDAFTDTTTVVYVSFGVGAAVDDVYEIVNEVTTADGRVDNQTITLRVIER
jgi:hypothetical protein